MMKHLAAAHGGSSTITLRNKLHNIRKHLKSISMSNFIRSLRHKFGSLPTEAKLFLLICSIFPDKHVIPFEDLAVCIMGLGLFEDVHHMFAARSRIHDIISIINGKKSARKGIVAEIGSSRENDGPHDQHVKLLDGAYDLAKSISRTYPFVFRREIIVGKWPESNLCKDCYGLSFVLKKVDEYPTHLECPRLALLQLKYKEDSQNIPIDFFEEMKELRVLSLDIPSLPQSINVLRNLRTLRLKVTKFKDVSSIGGLVNLEFLSISVLSSTEVPREIGQLGNLKFLDLRRMNITYFPPGILSRLLKLEELYLPLNFKNWECKAKNCDDHDDFELEEQDSRIDAGRIDAEISETDDQGRINASLIEIVSPLLNTLQVCVPKASVLPKSSRLFNNLRVFGILNPNNALYQPFGKYSVNVLQLTGDIRETGVCDLLRRTEDLHLTRVQNLKNVICQLEERGFPNLKKMIVSECDELEYIVDGTEEITSLEGDHLLKKLECLHLSMLPNLKEICRERWKSLCWFSNLSQINIRFCHKLKYLFPLSSVRGLTLTRVEILDCNEMEAMFYEDQEDNIPRRLCSIENLELYSLPRLNGLLVCKDNMIDDESLTASKEESISKFSKEIICSQPTLTSRENAQECVTQQHNFSNQDSAIQNKDAVSHLEMVCSFPFKYVAKWFKNLKSLKIAFCDSVKVIFFFEENHATSKGFNSLEVLELHGLRNLVHIWFRIPPKITAFKNLHLLVLSDSDSAYLLSYRVAKLLVQLQKVCISRCEKMEEIITVEDDENETNDRIVLPRLKHLELQQLPNLRVLFGGSYEIELSSLESLKLKQCNKMKCFSYGLTRMPMLEGVEVNGSFQLLRKDHNVIIKGVTIPHLFTLADLKIATNNFSSENILGGGFGTVYKGWIDKKTFAASETSVGLPVAIKRLNLESNLWAKVLESEMAIIGNKSHPNLVKWLGHCLEDGELLIVCEFIPRGSLSDYLFQRNLGVKPLSWDLRIKTAIGAAQGLNFLHTLDIVHTDVKVSNILLANSYNSKIADFGLAIWGPSDVDSDVKTTKYNAKMATFGSARLIAVGGESDVSTTGSIDNVDPAYYFSGLDTFKWDVYNYGVVLLQLMTGLEKEHRWRLGKEILIDWVKPNLSQKRELRNIMDSTMKGQYSSEAMSLMADLVLECTLEDPKMRPTMGEVIDKLQEIEAIKQKHEH